MAAPIHVFVVIHGMITDRQPSSHAEQYQTFWRKLQEAQPLLKEFFREIVFVEWGHQLSANEQDIRPDQRLTRAEAFVADQVQYEKLKANPGPNNVIMSGVFGGDHGIPGLRQIVMNIREGVVTFGLSDVAYYCSPDGERQVRGVVYTEVLNRLAPYLNESDVRLHIFSHSLGVIVAHDFLFGLFNADPNYEPGFVKDAQGSQEMMCSFLQWRAKAQARQLKLGSFASAASQLPLLVMRKQKLVDQLFAGMKINSADIGVGTGKVQWKLFYDIDDVLGFASRGLYSPDQAIMDIQVNSGSTPADAHTGYWSNSTVIEQTARLIMDNAT